MFLLKKINYYFNNKAYLTQNFSSIRMPTLR